MTTASVVGLVHGLGGRAGGGAVRPARSRRRRRRSGRRGGGFRGGGGAEAGRARASRAAAGRRNFRKAFANLAIASGKVTGVSGSTLTVSGISISPGAASPAHDQVQLEDQEADRKPKTETLKITTSSSTTVSATQTAASTALAVGDCVSAFGPAATNGAGHGDHRADHVDRRRPARGGFGRLRRRRRLRWSRRRGGPAAAVPVPKSGSRRAGAVPATGAPS